MQALKVAERAADGISTAVNALASLWIVVLMLLISADVGGRTVFNRPIIGVNEIVEFSIVAMLFLQVAHALSSGILTRSDAVFGALLKRARRVGLGFSAAFNLCGAILTGIIAWAGVAKTAEAYTGGFFIGIPGFFALPQAPLRAIIVFGTALMALRFILLVLRDLSSLVADTVPDHLRSYVADDVTPS